MQPQATVQEQWAEEPVAPSATVRALPAASLVDLVCDAVFTGEGRPVPAPPPAGEGFVLDGEPSLEMAIRYYRARTGQWPPSKEHLIGVLSCDIAAVDAMLSRQVCAVLHHPRFQRLEAAWRGVMFLAEAAEDREQVQIVVLDVSKRELAADLQGAMEFDQSQFFKKVYEERYGTAGGDPLGVIIGDYEFRNAPEDLDLLGKIQEVAAAAFSPFVAAVHPQMFGMQHFGQLERLRNLSDQFDGLRYVKWNALRDGPDSRYVGLTLPHILMRLPYGGSLVNLDGFVFEEDVTAPDRSGYLWGNAAFAFGSVLIRAFADSGWFADIRGTNQGPGTGGVVTGLPIPSYRTDRPGVALKSSLETLIGEAREKELADLGFMVLCDCEDTPYAAFFANPSIQKPKEYLNNLPASTNARMSAMLQYILCASRFAHYLKTIARNQVGRFREASALQAQLQSWIQQYVAYDPGSSPAARARFPLRDAKIEVSEHPGNPGHLLANLYLSPHVQLDELAASVRLVSEIRKE